MTLSFYQSLLELHFVLVVSKFALVLTAYLNTDMTSLVDF
jgi:hypothetical protein